MTTWPKAVIALLSGLALVASCSSANSPYQANDTPDACQSLAVPGSVSLSEPTAWIESADLPRYCRVRGTIAQRIQFEMRLPEEWNGRFLMAGCGGFCGQLRPDKPGHSNAINEALRRGYAAISHDSGHQAKSWETQWAKDPEALQLWAHRVLPVVSGVGNQLIESLYGKAAHHRYFSGCSNGGRLGLMAAQRYPDLFDGIAAGASIFDLSGMAGLWGNWLVTQNQADGVSRFPPAKIPLLSRVVMDQCDALDGMADGIISDPRVCEVDFSAAACGDENPDSESCFRPEEVKILRRLYGGVLNDSGDIVYPSAPFGSEPFSGIWLFGTGTQPAWGALASAGYRQLLAMDLGEPDQPNGLSTNQMIDWISRSSVPGLTDAEDPDLSGLRDSKGKLLIYQGWSDPLIIPQPIADYYRQAQQAAGGLDALQDYARLVMIPGWGHCWEKPAAAADDFDPLLAVQRWVEEGVAPDYLIATGTAGEGDDRSSRLLCAWPRTARLIDGQDPGRYTSYRCVSGDEEPDE
jgi:feruloyl esterase